MNDNHRRQIVDNLDRLVSSTEYDAMVCECIHEKIITDTMAKIIEQDAGNDEDRKRLLFKKIIHRGPTAFEKLLNILKKQNYTEAYKLLMKSPVVSKTFNDEDVTLDQEDMNTVSISSTRNILHERQLSNSSNNQIWIDDVVDKCEIKCDGPIFSKNEKRKLEVYEESTSFLTSLEVKRAQQFGTHPKLAVYNTKSEKRGVFFFVNIITFTSKKPRRGAHRDRDNLITLFRELGYKVFYYEDITREQFMRLIQDLIKSDHLKHIDSFVMCIQTHGNIENHKTIMEFHDDTTLGIDEVINDFSNRSCESLVNKPKIFFFPFCRGTNSDKAEKTKAYRRDSDIETDGHPGGGVPSFSDILICYGTVPGFATHRDVETGSWYATEICKVFAEHAHDTHLEDLMKLVAQNTSEIRDDRRLQMASTENRGFNRIFFFNPKINEI